MSAPAMQWCLGDNDAKPERNAQIAALVASGTTTLEQVGQFYGITRERVRQIAEKQGVTVRVQNAVDPLVVMRALRNRECMSWGALGRMAGTHHAREVVANLGLTVAAVRLFRWRKSRIKRDRLARLIAAYHAERDRLGRPLTTREVQALSPAPISIWRKHYVSKLRVLVGEAVYNSERRVSRRGQLTETVLRLASRPQGCTPAEVAAACSTTLGSADVTIRNLVASGRVEKSADSVRGRPIYRSRALRSTGGEE